MKQPINLLTKPMIDAANGNIKAELVFKNATVLNVFTNEFIQQDIAVCGDTIIGVGAYSGEKEIDCNGKYVVPGFIDAHLHIESSMLCPQKFAQEILPWGTTTMIADPHEIANVSGMKGLEYILAESEKSLCNIFIMLPSCVPATEFDESGAILEAKDLISLQNHPNVLGLGEMMNYPAVVSYNEAIFEKLNAFQSQMIDGHAPLLVGTALQAYKLAGIQTDHEVSNAQEVLEKVRTGFNVLIREGSAAKNLEVIVNSILKYALPTDRFAFCTDDKHIEAIRNEGHISFNIKKAIQLGLSPIEAYKISSYYAAKIYGLRKLGAVAAGYQADFVVLDDINEVSIDSVYCKGKCVKEELQKAISLTDQCPASLLQSVNIHEVTKKDLILEWDDKPFPVIELVPHQILTKKSIEQIPLIDGVFHANETYQKIVVIDRHQKTGRMGIGVVKGMHLHGAAASTVSHDSHNLILIGDNDEDMLLAINELKRSNGGFTIVKDGVVLDTLPLPICGLVSNQDADFVNQKLNKMTTLSRQSGVPDCFDPFLTMAFLSLPVIPEIRITANGIFDSVKYEYIK
ncbi:adenine deaminase [Paludicola sp. MB14-C6]|uniref:adenine deaminase n=1 Tax=Paludihabitans sp. MB14-C6 TaxID=3070656 RepID=UPI0027DD596A|nr:adenine deaminase [Paludicola sp. MB14-C6]WMJ22533.1 adenine deaminase [Paludicola sp. MB14-C6]